MYGNKRKRLIKIAYDPDGLFVFTEPTSYSDYTIECDSETLRTDCVITKSQVMFLAQYLLAEKDSEIKELKKQLERKG